MMIYQRLAVETIPGERDVSPDHVALKRLTDTQIMIHRQESVAVKSEVIFTGTELILGQILNTNAQYLQQSLAALGIDLYFQVTVGDNKKRLVEAILQASSRSDIVIIGGGLGPTEDDLSREALSDAIHVPLLENPIARVIAERFYKNKNSEMPLNNLKQALAPPKSLILDNPVGTAPGLALEYNCTLFILVPGPPYEFITMIDNQVIPLLRKKLGPEISVIKSRILKLCGIGEAKIDEILGPLLHGNNPTLAPTAKHSEVHLRITSKSSSNEEADRMNDEMEERIRELLGQYIYGKDDETLSEVVGKMLAARKFTLAIAETCSGGYLSHLITSFHEGADYLKFAAVSNIEGMADFLRIKLTQKGLADALANGIRKKATANIGIAITKELRDNSSSKSKKIIIAISFEDTTLIKETELWSEGNEFRLRTVQSCLVLLWKTLKNITLN